MEIRTIRLADLYKIKIQDKSEEQINNEIQFNISDRVSGKVSTYKALCKVPNIISYLIEHSINNK